MPTAGIFKDKKCGADVINELDVFANNAPAKNQKTAFTNFYLTLLNEWIFRQTQYYPQVD